MKSFASAAILPSLFLALLVTPATVYAQAEKTPAPVPAATAPVPAPTAVPADHAKPTPPTRVEVTPKNADAIGPLLLTQQDNLKLQAELAQTKAAAQAQAAIAPLQTDYANIDKLVDEWVKSVKLANNWGDNVTFDKATRKFYQTTNATTTPLTPRAPVAPVAPKR